MRSSQVVSDYLYEATDPFTDTTVIVDATPPFSCYGRYANDGLDEFEANSILEFDEEGEVILTALTTIEPGAELFSLTEWTIGQTRPDMIACHFLPNNGSKRRIQISIGI